MLDGTKMTFYSLDPSQHQECIAHLKGLGSHVRSLNSLDFKIKPDTDVILIEANFPYFKIFKFLKMLQGTQSTATVLLIGPNLEVSRVGALLRAGVFDYLKIPFSPNRLKKAIREGLDNRSNLLKVLNLSQELEAANKKISKERDHLKKWNSDLSQIYDLNQKLSESLHIDEVVTSLMTHIKKIVPYDLASLYLKSWGQVRVEANQEKWGHLIRQVSSEMRLEGQRFNKSKRSHARTLVRDGDSEIIVPLEVEKNKIGILRLIRKGNGGLKNEKSDTIDGQKKIFSDYQLKVLSMISAPLAIAIRNAEMYKKVEDLAVKDPLTHALNRRALPGILEREFRRAERYNTALALMIIDLDHFKMVNDTYGHLAGDQVLREMAAIFQKSLRDIDVLIRYGGEEFVIILPGTNLQKGMVVANRIKDRVENAIFNEAEKGIRMTVSIGIANYPVLPIIAAPKTLFSQADQALYAAKRQGRNQIMTSTKIMERKNSEALILEGHTAS